MLTVVLPDEHESMLTIVRHVTTSHRQDWRCQYGAVSLSESVIDTHDTRVSTAINMTLIGSTPRCIDVKIATKCLYSMSHGAAVLSWAVLTRLVDFANQMLMWLIRRRNKLYSVGTFIFFCLVLMRSPVFTRPLSISTHKCVGAAMNK